jgi:hypothetical protein
MLELDEGQLSRPVLRGGGGGNATSLPDRIEPFAGERLFSLDRHKVLFERRAGTAKAEFFHLGLDQAATFDLREPEIR